MRRTLYGMQMLSLSLLMACASAPRRLPIVLDTPLAASAVRAAEADFTGCSGVQMRPDLVDLKCAAGPTLKVTRLAAGARDAALKSFVEDWVRSDDYVAPGRLVCDAAQARCSVQARYSNGTAFFGIAARAVGDSTVLAQCLDTSGSPARCASMIESVLATGVPSARVTGRRPAQVDLAGRPLAVPRGCSLMGAQNLACYPGQVDWQVFGDESTAQRVLKERHDGLIALAKGTPATATVPCHLEGVATDCTRSTVDIIPAPIRWIQTVYPLIVIRAAAPVRGQWLAVTCSFYEDEAPPGGLARLCGALFTLD